MNGKKASIFSTWGKPKKTQAELLEAEAAHEAVLLDRDILDRQLKLIDDQHKHASLMAQKAFLADWLSRTRSSDNGA